MQLPEKSIKIDLLSYNKCVMSVTFSFLQLAIGNICGMQVIWNKNSTEV